ncbi:YegP family protein [Phenylobacterium sp.]|jgi:uncharacterized protein YegP (UPF0339 family)|uniref:YegP family protein n=1 Tax=Phenylobacterium sp. TaxID=1871053 RepID=UPI0037C8A872
MAHRFEIYKDKVGEHRVRFVQNGEVVFSTDAYSSKSGAKKAIENIRKNTPGAEVFDATI